VSAPSIANLLAPIYDPEIGIDIVSMGLVYGIEETGTSVTVRMTTTFAGCPMGDAIAAAVERALKAARPDSTIAVEVTHDPPWSPAMLSDGARRRLGLD
jgi:metal-sulfur cluster biosynthetic enzyme